MRIAYVRWFDSSIYKGEAFDPKLLHGFCENQSAGLLIADDGDSIAIALDFCVDSGEIRLALCIPRVNVRSIQYFDATVEEKA